MLAAAQTYALLGVEARPVRAEVDVRTGLSAFQIVGLPDTAVRESRERVRAALENSGFDFPNRRITVNLAPANLPKTGPGFDLAIAAALLAASGQISGRPLADLALAGELALDGEIRPVPGALPMAERARRDGLGALAVAGASAREAALANLITVNGNGGGALRVLALASLRQLQKVGGPEEPAAVLTPELTDGVDGGLPDLSELRGQEFLRHALEVAAAGGHSLLLTGPPGVGKSLAARRLPSILPPLAVDEAIEVLRISSACGLTGSLRRARVRPYRAPHHTISTAGLIGGGSPPRPGELTLAHRGVLFLDELPEFSRDSLEALRQPLEEGEIVISRVRHSVRLPCRAMLVAAANPCPCGKGNGDERCECTLAQVRRYRLRISAPLADRIDISVEVGRPTAEEMGSGPGEPSSAVRPRVIAARAIQERRLGPGRCNASMTPAEIRRHVSLDREAEGMLAGGYLRLGLSGRGYDRVARVARTLADLDGRPDVSSDDVAAALSLRTRAEA